MNPTPVIVLTLGFVATGLTLALAQPKDSDAETNKGATMQNIQINRVGSQPSVTPPADWFTGTVRLDPLVDAKDPSNVSMANVTFEPGARTVWHTHPLGQHLYITNGLGWVQEEGGGILEVRPGDVVWFPPNVKCPPMMDAETHRAVPRGMSATPNQTSPPCPTSSSNSGQESRSNRSSGSPMRSQTP